MILLTGLVLEWERLYLHTQNCSDSLCTELIFWHRFLFSNGSKAPNWSTPYPEQSDTATLQAAKKKYSGLGVCFEEAKPNLSENKTFIWWKFLLISKTLITIKTMQFTYQLPQTRSLSPAGFLLSVAEFSLPWAPSSWVWFGVRVSTCESRLWIKHNCFSLFPLCFFLFFPQVSMSRT